MILRRARLCRRNRPRGNGFAPEAEIRSREKTSGNRAPTTVILDPDVRRTAARALISAWPWRQPQTGPQGS